jgi:hypothetical protein
MDSAARFLLSWVDDPWAAVVYGSIIGVLLAYVISWLALIVRSVMRGAGR